MRRLSLIPIVVSVVLVTAACGSDPEPFAAVPSLSVSPAAAAPVPSVAAEPMDAKAVLDALAAADLPLSSITAQDEDTDPNGKLGRPGGYTSRASADLREGDKEAPKYDVDRGIVVEVFATPEDATARADFIQDAKKNVQLLVPEYHYRPADKRVLVRLTGAVKPSKAKAYEAAVAAL
jgi:hypothetical protein